MSALILLTNLDLKARIAKKKNLIQKKCKKYYISSGLIQCVGTS